MNKFSRLLMVSVVVCTSISVGLLCGSHKQLVADIGYSPAKWNSIFPEYPKSDGIYSIGDDMLIDGIPMKMSYFMTDDDIAKVVDYYMGVWESQGRSPEYRKLDEKSVSIMVYDEENQQFLTVNIMDRGTDRLIMPTISRVQNIKEDGFNRQREVVKFPVPEKATMLHNQESSTGPIGSLYKMYKVEQSVADIMAFYISAMPTMGLSLDRRSTQEDVELLFFSAGKTLAVVSLRAVTEVPPITIVTLSLMEEP